MAMNPPASRTLLLEDAQTSEQTGWRRNQELIDALPYIDELTPDMRKKVTELIEEEMRVSTKKPQDFLKDLPPVPPVKFEGHPLLAAEFERIRNQIPMPPIDTVRHQLNPPPLSKRNEYPAWKAALDNAQSQLEHQRLRILNLELMLKYGQSTWRGQNQQNEAAIKRLEAELAELKASTEHINKERKLQQQAVGGDLRRLEAEYVTVLQKNMDIESACAEVEWANGMMRAELEARAAPQANGIDGHAAEAAAPNGSNGREETMAEAGPASEAPQEEPMAEAGPALEAGSQQQQASVASSEEAAAAEAQVEAMQGPPTPEPQPELEGGSAQHMGPGDGGEEAMQGVQDSGTAPA